MVTAFLISSAHLLEGGNNDAIYINQSGTGDFAKVEDGDAVTDDSATFGITAADFNNDGNMDIVAGHFNPEPHTIYLGDGKGSFAKVSNSAPHSRIMTTMAGWI